MRLHLTPSPLLTVDVQAKIYLLFTPPITCLTADMPPKVLQPAPTEFRSQFTHPGNIFSILLLLGPEIMAQAIAQLAGGLLCPVTFSFGWVAYGVAALVSAVGENKLMPDVTRGSSSIVTNGNNGYVRNNNSWVIERLIRDYEKWIHPDTEAAWNLTRMISWRPCA